MSNSDAQRHITSDGQQCSVNFGAMLFDPDCARCGKINKVIMLKRKRTSTGCLPGEAAAALAMATRIIEQYRLTKGEVFDREYDVPVIVQRQAAQKEYNERWRGAGARHTYTRRPTGFRKMSGYYKVEEDMYSNE